MAVLGQSVRPYGSVLEVFLVADFKVHARAVPYVEQGKVVVEPVGHDDAALQQGHIVSTFVVGRLAIGNVHVGGQVAIVIEQGMHFNRALGRFVAYPITERQVKADDGGIQQEYLRLYAELHLLKPRLLS